MPTLAEILVAVTSSQQTAALRDSLLAALLSWATAEEMLHLCKLFFLLVGLGRRVGCNSGSPVTCMSKDSLVVEIRLETCSHAWHLHKKT
jgi:hypothetical protein